jgi:hypothetical protein
MAGKLLSITYRRERGQLVETGRRVIPAPETPGLPDHLDRLAAALLPGWEAYQDALLASQDDQAGLFLPQS